MRFVNVSGDTQDLPTLGDLRVGPGEEFDASGDDAKGLAGNPAFERVDKTSGKSGTDKKDVS